MADPNNNSPIPVIDRSAFKASGLGEYRRLNLFRGWPSQFRINKYGFTPESVGSSGVQAWNNGRFRNVKHRVQCKEAGVRVSIASLLFGPKESDVTSPSELVDEEHPRLYLPFSYEDYRKLRISTNLHDGGALELLLA